ncbi:MAG: DNA-processing protein DprA [Minisyncoccota bacterium]
MEEDHIKDLRIEDWPELLKEINDPPKKLHLWGSLPNKGNKLLAIVGSRKYTSYGQEICNSLIQGLSGYPITIVSGLALGIDSIAHRSAMRAGLQTVAVPGSGLSDKVLHPRSHVELAKEIVSNGGGLISEYNNEMPSGAWAFPRRNRIMAGMCHATLVIEAEKKSGTLITSRLATEYNREVAAVPGPITSSTSEGPHMLIRLGAALIRDSNDLLELLGLRSEEHDTLFDTNSLTEEERVFIEMMGTPQERDTLIRKSGFDTSKANAVLSLLEIKGLIIEELGEVRKTF